VSKKCYLKQICSPSLWEINHSAELLGCLRKQNIEELKTASQSVLFLAIKCYIQWIRQKYMPFWQVLCYRYMYMCVKIKTLYGSNSLCLLTTTIIVPLVAFHANKKLFYSNSLIHFTALCYLKTLHNCVNALLPVLLFWMSNYKYYKTSPSWKLMLSDIIAKRL